MTRLTLDFCSENAQFPPSPTGKRCSREPERLQRLCNRFDRGAYDGFWPEPEIPRQWSRASSSEARICHAKAASKRGMQQRHKNAVRTESIDAVRCCYRTWFYLITSFSVFRMMDSLWLLCQGEHFVFERCFVASRQFSSICFLFSGILILFVFGSYDGDGSLMSGFKF